MKTLIRSEIAGVEKASDEGFAVDTTFVLFFLGLEFGQSIGNFGLETIFTGLTLAAFAALPYFLSRNDAKFGSWLLGRGLIAAFSIILGLIFKQTLGVILPEMFRFLPMTLLLLTAFLSFYFQFYGFYKLRLAK